MDSYSCQCVVSHLEVKMQLLRSSASVIAIVSLLQSVVVPVAHAWSPVTSQPDVAGVIEKYFNDPSNDPDVTQSILIDLLKKKIKYVFVIFNENHSFDNEFGTFPGVNGLYSDGQTPRPGNQTRGFTQIYTDVTTGKDVCLRPFRIGPNENASVVDSVDHSHTGLAQKIDVVDGKAKMDQFAAREYSRFNPAGSAANEVKGTQFARLVMSHIDCDTIPFFWQWASRFTIFDQIFATEDTPSTPNAVAMIAGQSGETQWVKHHDANGQPLAQYGTTGGQSYALQTPPLVNDPQPFYGSQFDPTTGDRQPAGLREY